jgi:hypothetical protein
MWTKTSLKDMAGIYFIVEINFWSCWDFAFGPGKN